MLDVWFALYTEAKRRDGVLSFSQFTIPNAHSIDASYCLDAPMVYPAGSVECFQFGPDDFVPTPTLIERG